MYWITREISDDLESFDFKAWNFDVDLLAAMEVQLF